MTHAKSSSVKEVLLVEDNPGDIGLIDKAMKNSRIQAHLNIVPNGEMALLFLNKAALFKKAPTPDLILLDLNLPQLSGKEVLETLKAHPEHRRIPVIVLTSSRAMNDVMGSYGRYANSFITKPSRLDGFMHVIQSLEEFWFNNIQLPAEGPPSIYSQSNTPKPLVHVSESSERQTKEVEILVVEDDPDDIVLIRRALKQAKLNFNLHFARDGVKALAFLKQKDIPQPDLVLLDLNMPLKNGFETLTEIKTDPDLKHIPVVVLTSSGSQKDILKAYDAYVTCYMVKPQAFNQFVDMMKALEKYWFSIATLPNDESE